MYSSLTTLTLLVQPLMNILFITPLCSLRYSLHAGAVEAFTVYNVFTMNRLQRGFDYLNDIKVEEKNAKSYNELQNMKTLQ